MAHVRIVAGLPSVVAAAMPIRRGLAAIRLIVTAGSN
jgi:hypothetical protein